MRIQIPPYPPGCNLATRRQTDRAFLPTDKRTLYAYATVESRTVIISWIAVTVAVMFALPFAVARFASEYSGMALCMILFFIVNPVYSAILGFRCGRNIRQMWHLPVLSSVAFLAGTWLFFDIKELLFIVYASVYLILGCVAMGISNYLNNESIQNK